MVSIPYIDILIYLPELIDPLFLILGDSNSDIQSTCHKTLSELLQKIKASPHKVDFSKMTNMIVVHSQSSDNLIKETALKWLVEFIQLAKADILPFTCGILTSIIPTLACDDSINGIWETAKKANHCLMCLITSKDDFTSARIEVDLRLPEIVEVFIDHLKLKSTLPKIAIIRWVHHLLIKIPFMLFQHIDSLFNEILKLTSDPSNDLVILTLECLAEIASSPAGVPINRKVVSTATPSPLTVRKISWNSSKSEILPSQDSTSSIELNTYFTKAISQLLKMFKENSVLLEKRAAFIIRQLSSLLNAENVYRALAEEISSNPNGDPSFFAVIIKKLNSILMTSSELVELRNQLKNDHSKKNCELFCCLYKSWCHDPIAVVSLCLLTQNYEHCCKLVHKLASYEMTVNLLVETDKLIQLLESPIFAYLRLQLLESPHRQYLVKSLYSLLMILPQGRSFDTLHNRLNSVPNHHLLPDDIESTKDIRNSYEMVDFKDLFLHFIWVQNLHALEKQKDRLAASTIES